jgi:hypothetical protein
MTVSKIKEDYQFHELAGIFPLMTEENLTALKNDIAKNGQIEPIWIYDGRIIDGRNRYNALESLGIEPKVIEWQGEEKDLLGFVVSLNLHRRHLNESQRGIVAGKLANLENGKRPTPIDVGVTQAEAAELLNVSVKSVQRAKKVIEKAIPELTEKVSQGEVAVSTAAVIADLPKKEQSEIVAKGEKEILSAAKEIKAKKLEEKQEYLASIDPNKDVVGNVEEFAANEKKQIRWYNIVHDLYKLTNSIAHNGGILTMTKTWSPKRIDSFIKEVEKIENNLKRIRKEVENGVIN